MPGRAEINALHEDQLRPVLESLGVARAFDAGTLHCDFCERPLREAGVGTVRMEQGRLIFACGNLRCVELFYD